jgi:hypothetical protein
MSEIEFYEDLDDLELTHNFITHARRKRDGPRQIDDAPPSPRALHARAG